MQCSREDTFAMALGAFPRSAQPYLENLSRQGGELSGKALGELLDRLNVSMEALMIRLLPLAKLFSLAMAANRRT